MGIGIVEKLVNKIDVIIPVYADYQVTRACLESVFGSNNLQDYNLLVIYDCGPDPQLEAYLDELSVQRKIQLSKNKSNLGFVESVNQGMRCNEDNDVLLLNSDTLVANDWLDRIVACAMTDEKIATVTPFSSNAEICSFPRFCRDNSRPDNPNVEAIDRVFAQYVEPAAIDIPTGVGFCMFIRRASLVDIGLFDAETYGRGYGEENDFCRKGAAAGWRNVHCTNTYVFHQGGVSFTDEKLERVEQAMKILDRLYPDYHQLVQEFIIEDPAKVYRVQGMIELYRHSSRKHCLMITHGLGGGTLKHAEELANYLEEEIVVAILRPLDEGVLSLQFCFGDNSDTLTFDVSEQFDALENILSYICVDYVHVHHIKGLDGIIENLLARLECPYDVSLHDYYFINGNPALADEQGRFCEDMTTRDQLCVKHSPVPLGLDANAWRDKNRRFLCAAERVIAPSQYVKDIFSDYFADVSIDVAPHPDHEVNAPYPLVSMPAKGDIFRIAVIGALGIEKGADVLESVAGLCIQNGKPYKFYLIGYAYRELDRCISQSGAYKDGELASLLENIDPHLVWFPSQWPETYSYTLSTCLQMGLPVLAPDFGAFSERLRGRPLSWVEDHRVNPAGWVASIDNVVQTISKGSAPVSGCALSKAWEGQTGAGTYYREKYLTEIHRRTRGESAVLDLATIGELLARSSDRLALLGRKEKFLRVLIRLRGLPLIRWLVRLVPFRVQRRIKRLLSSRAIHEVAD